MGSVIYDHLRLEEFIGGSSGLAAAVISNWLGRLPLLSRLPLLFAGTAVGIGFGYAVRSKKEQMIADREYMIWDYVKRHPEDFPELQPKKYKDVLLEWHPIR